MIRHILHLHVTGEDADAVGSACADIDAMLDESQATGAWPDGVEVWWEWLPTDGDA